MSEPKPLLAPLRPPATEPRLWKEAGFVDDTWTVIADDAPLPDGGQVIVSLARWRNDRASLTRLGVPIGVAVPPGEELDPLADEVEWLQLVQLVFPKFTDGRAYSTARRLREHGFSGEIRATGDVLLDQIPLMVRCGFDALQIVHAPTVAALHRGELPAVTRSRRVRQEAAAS
jgi:uncharacterized protein (DUF934 family)